MTTIIIRLTFFGLINAAIFFSLINGQRQIPSSPSSSSFNQFFPLQRPNLQLIQLHAAQQQQRSFPPLNQRRIFRTQQQITRRPIPRISLRRRSLSSERNLRAGISRNKPARIILDPNLSNEKITSENRFPPQLRTQGNADFSRTAATVAPQRFAPPPRQQRLPPPIEVTPSRMPVRPPLRRPPPSTQTNVLQQRPPQPQLQQQRQQRPPPRSPPPQPQPRAPLQQQQQQQTSQRASTQQQQQAFLRAPTSMTPRMQPQQPPPQNLQNRPSQSIPRPPSPPRPQTRSQSAPSPPQSQQQTFNQPRPPPPPIQQARPPSPTMPSPPPPPQQQPQQMRRRITPEQRFTRPEQARVLPSAPIGPPRPSSITTNNIDEQMAVPPQSRVRPSSPPSVHMPGFLPPSNSVVDELNNSNNFLEVARRLHLRRVVRGSAH